MGVRNGLALLGAAYAALVCPAAAEPVGDWPLNEGGGQVAADRSGHGHTGILGESGQPDAHDPLWIPGRFGSALRFDAANDHFVSIRPAAALFPLRLTVETWVRRLGTPGSWRYVFSSGARACHSAPYGLYSGFGGGLAFYISGTERVVISPEATASAVWDGAWHYAVGTFDGDAVRLYVDGVEVAGGTPTNQSFSYVSTANGVFIGTYRGTCARPFTGDIDEVVIRDDALSTERVADVARSRLSSPMPPQAPPVSGPPAADRGAFPDTPTSTDDQLRCLTIRVRPRRITVGRRARIVVAVHRRGKPAPGARIRIRGAGVRRTVRAGASGKRRLTVRATRHGRVSLTVGGRSSGCGSRFVTVTP